jgi:hypothetical protein
VQERARVARLTSLLDIQTESDPDLELLSPIAIKKRIDSLDTVNTPSPPAPTRHDGRRRYVQAGEDDADRGPVREEEG